MTYIAKENSLYEGNPQELYMFSYGAGPTEVFYTSADESEVYDGDTYTPYPIQRSDVSLGYDQIQLQVPVDCPVYTALSTQTTIELTIYRKHRDDAGTIVLWKGRVQSAQVSGDRANLTCWSLLKMTELPMPQYMFQTGCNWSLYSTRCGVNKAGNDFLGNSLKLAIGSVAALNARKTKIFDSDIGFADPPFTRRDIYNTYYTGGFAEWTDGAGVVHRRFIIASDCRLVADLNYIVILTPFPAGFVATEALDIYAGCTRSLVPCNNKFANVVNYGGFPWIPRINPFTLGVK